ncbi:YggN family protein [Xanthomonas campestris pv. phormiicola]|nr:YggN family protein [Xanthomonas campestris pv. phormiicola]UYC17980.1 YggN family protein [Xanthomonas campestris pv. phormiicola]
MRRSWPFLLLLLSAFGAPAQAEAAGEVGKHGHRPQLSSRQCGLGTPFNVLADSGGIWLYRTGGSPREIFFHGGALSVDHTLQQISAGDAQRLQEMERDIRVLMPQVAEIAHAAVDLSYDALGGVVEVLTGSWLNARKIERLRKRANAYVDGTLGKGRWEQDAFGGNFGKYVEVEAEAFKGSIARHMLWQIATGRADAIDARAARMDGALDARLDAQGEAIEAKAEGVCSTVAKLRRLQDALEFRYQDQPLRMLAPAQDDGSGAGIDVAADAGRGPGGGDKPRSDAIGLPSVPLR